jgi:hypothetical protein
MGIGTMKSGLYPLIRGGGASGQRNPDIPSLVTPRLANAAGYFEDFVGVGVGPTGFSEGSPSTYGQPAWIYTTLGGGGGSVGCSANTSAIGLGVMALAASSGGGFLVYPGARTTANGGTLLAGTTNKSLGMFRFSFGGTSSSRIDGLGWIRQSFSTTTDWATDPDVTLAGTDAIVLTRHSSAYGAFAGGDWVLRVYSTIGADTEAKLLLAAASGDTVPHKLEVYCSGSSNLKFYWDEALVWDKTLSDLTNTNYRFSMASIPSAASKTLAVDCVYQELSLTSAR